MYHTRATKRIRILCRLVRRFFWRVGCPICGRPRVNRTCDDPECVTLYIDRTSL